MPNKPNHKLRYCITCSHTKETVKSELLAEETKLLNLEQQLKTAKGEDADRIKTEITACKAKMEKLENYDTQWAPLSSPMNKSLDSHAQRVIKHLKAEIEAAKASGNAAEVARLEAEQQKATQLMHGVKQYLASPYGKAGICKNCATMLAERFDITTDTSKKFLPMPGKTGSDGKDIKIDDLPMPSDILAYLNEYIIGQRFAKVTLASEIALHYRKVFAQLEGRGPADGSDYKKSNILLIGPTGCGKTAILNTIRDFLAQYLGEIPMVSESASRITEEGYVGKSVDEMIQALYRKAEKSVRRSKDNKNLKEEEIRERAVQLTEIGMVHIDEIDKIADDGSGAGGSVSRKGAQDALLTMLEGEIVTIKIPVGQGQAVTLDIDTSRMIFFGSGAFAGNKTNPSVYKISQGHVEEGTRPDPLGISTSEAVALDKKYREGEQLNISADDIIEYGLSPELVGRFHLIATLDNLSTEALRHIMTEPKGAILNQVVGEMKDFYNIEIDVQEAAMDELAEQAKERGTGARALASVIKTALFPITGFPENYMGSKVIVSEESLTDATKMQVVHPESGEVTGEVKTINEQVDPKTEDNTETQKSEASK